MLPFDCILGPGNKLVHPIDGDGLIVALPFTGDLREYFNALRPVAPLR
jgi:hypothetical protein